ncbi:MAG: TolC family protein [Steroidobacteraceae bacterium]
MTEITGAPATKIAALRDTIPLESPDPASVEDWVGAALKDNPVVRAAQLLADASDRDIDVQRGKGLPSVQLGASRSRSWADLTIGGNGANDQIGVSVTWPLFQGGAVASQIRQSRANWKQALANYAGTQRDAERPDAHFLSRRGDRPSPALPQRNARWNRGGSRWRLSGVTWNSGPISNSTCSMHRTTTTAHSYSTARPATTT